MNEEKKSGIKKILLTLVKDVKNSVDGARSNIEEEAKGAIERKRAKLEDEANAFLEKTKANIGKSKITQQYFQNACENLEKYKIDDLVNTARMFDLSYDTKDKTKLCESIANYVTKFPESAYKLIIN
jgi:Holliday junction resolvase-like predicted endonuclease